MYEMTESEIALVHGGTIDLTALFSTAVDFLSGLGALLNKAAPLVSATATWVGALATFFKP